MTERWPYELFLDRNQGMKAMPEILRKAGSVFSAIKTISTTTN
jgi:hypothetical protein